MSTLDNPGSAGPRAAAVLSLVAGLWILTAGGMTSMGSSWGMMGGGGNGARPSTMHSLMWHHEFTGPYGSMAWWSGMGVLAGLSTVVFAVLLFAQPRLNLYWGAAIIASSAAGLLVGAGGVFGGLLGMLGGILAMLWRGPTV